MDMVDGMAACTFIRSACAVVLGAGIQLSTYTRHRVGSQSFMRLVLYADFSTCLAQ